MQNYTPSYSFSTTVNGDRTFHHRWHTNNGQIYECPTCRSSCAANESYATHWRHEHERYTYDAMTQLALVAQHIESVKLEKFILCNKYVRKMNGDTAERHQFLLDAGIKAIPQFLHFMLHDTEDEISLQLGLHVRVKESSTSTSSTLVTKKTSRFTKKLTKAKNCKRPNKVSATYEALEEAFEAAAAEIRDTHDMTSCVSDDLLYCDETFEAEKTMLLFKSSFLTITTHYDIEESVDVLLTMLLERVERHLLDAFNTKITHEYEVQRIEINLKRLKVEETQQRQLPLQYSVKKACFKRLETSTSFSNIVKNSNFYTFKTCRYTGELFVVPYFLSSTAATCNTPNFIMISTNAGKPKHFLRIKSLRKFLRHETGDCVLSCKFCDAKFMQQTKLELHMRLQCGRHFKVIKMAADFVELYERCLPLQCAAYNWPLYGIME